MTLFDANTRIVIVGGGKMGAALAGGMIEAQSGLAACVSACNITIVNPSKERRVALTERYGVTCVEHVSELSPSDVVFLAVKPQILADVLDDIAQSALGNQVRNHQSPLFVSIAAGVSIDFMSKHLPCGARVVRVMPNMPLRVKAGASGVAGVDATNEDAQEVNELFASFGTSYVVDESDLDAVTAVSGSGPAWVCALIEGMREGGVACGLSSEVSEKLALQTVLGTVLFIEQSGLSVHEVLESICSPGGTTIAGLSKMNELGFTEAIVEGERACANRSRELGAS